MPIKSFGRKKKTFMQNSFSIFWSYFNRATQNNHKFDFILLVIKCNIKKKLMKLLLKCNNQYKLTHLKLLRKDIF